MKQLEYLYFNIYNHYNKRSYYPDGLFVRLLTMYLLSLSAGGWILLVQAGFLRFVRQAWFTSPQAAMLFAVSVYLVVGLMFYRIFIVNEHDQKIVNKYADAWNRNPNKKRDLLISALIAIVPYVILLTIKMMFAKS